MRDKQVDKSHYDFKKYLTIKRWMSLWHQVDEILDLSPNRLLEIGPGIGVLQKILIQFGVKAESLDIDPELNPNYVGSVLNLPFEDNTFDCVCAFQMLEHIPYGDSLKAFREMVRVSRKNIVISLPDAKKRLPIMIINLPKITPLYIYIPQLTFGLKEHKFDGEHYWEISKKDYSLSKVLSDFLKSDVDLIKTFRVAENPYHRFFIFSKK